MPSNEIHKYNIGDVIMKDLEFYMSQNYRMVVYPLSEDDGGGWMAEIPELNGCASDGETYEKALFNLQEAKEAWLTVAIKRGQSISLPTADSEKNQFSGKFTLRIPKTLHRNISMEADEEGVSLNSYLLSIISERHGRTTIVPLVEHYKVYGSLRQYNYPRELQRQRSRNFSEAVASYSHRSEVFFGGKQRSVAAHQLPIDKY